MDVDSVTYCKRLQESVNTLDYVLDPIRFEHQHTCRHELGLVGGTAVSHIEGNLVDLESELRGQTRLLAKCPTNQWTPPDISGSGGFWKGGSQLITNDKTEPINTRLKHLPACQMIGYRSVPLPPPMNLPTCK